MDTIKACDLHTHSTASDGTDAPGALAELALGRGIGVLAVTDHDNVEGVLALAGRAPDGLRVIPGVELSSRAGEQDCHILGLGIDPAHPAMVSALGRARELRRGKLEARIAALRRAGVPEWEWEALRRLPGAGKPHIAALLVKYSAAPDLPAAFRLLGDIPTPPDRLDAALSAAAIRESGGIPVWAHPLGEEGRPLTWPQMLSLLPALLDAGVEAMECWYSKYPPELCRSLERLSRANGLLVSGGSDYHGANKPVPLGRLNSAGDPVPMSALTVLGAIK